MTTVAVLGTGIMGSAMVRNLLAAGYEVRVWNRTAGRAGPLAEQGAVVVDSPAEAVSGASVLLTVLRDDSAVRQAVDEALSAAGAGLVWGDLSTVGVDEVTRLARLAGERGVEFVDAPVLGTKQPAEQGELVVLAAGSESVRARLDPVFAVLGRRTEWVDEDASRGTATAVKMVLNSWVLNLTGAVGESVSLAEGLGVDPRLFLDLVSGGGMDTPYLHVKSGAILSGDYEPSFTVDNAGKDVGLILDAARDAGVRLDLLEGMRQRLRRASDAGHGAQDMAASYFASGGSREGEA